MQNIACVARGEREGVIPRKRPRVSGAHAVRFFYARGNLSPRSRNRHALSTRVARSLLFKSARLASRKLTRNMVRRQCFLLPNDKKNRTQCASYSKARGFASRKLTFNMVGRACFSRPSDRRTRLFLLLFGLSQLTLQRISNTLREKDHGDDKRGSDGLTRF